jgi:hypothetical protein
MKGILKYTIAGWFVWYQVRKDKITSGYDSIPLHPSEKVDDSFRDKEVEFKIVYYLETGIEEPFKVAELVKAYPYLKGTMNLCEDIIKKKTGKMTEEEWQAAERAQTGTKQETIEEVALKYLKSKGVKMYPEEVHLFTAGAKWQQEQDSGKDTADYIDKNLVQALVEIGKTQMTFVPDKRMYSEEEVIDFLQEMNDWPTTFEGRIDIREWFEQFKKK